MESTNQQIAALILKYLCQELTAEEKSELDEWINASDRNMQLFHRCTDEAFIEQGLEKMDKLGDEDVWENEKVWRAIGRRKPAKVLLMAPLKKIGYVAAASIIVLLGIVGYHWAVPEKTPGTVAVINTPEPVIVPGTNKAMLQLADGTLIPLDSMGKGTLAQQGGTDIVKLDSGQLAYHADASLAEADAYNTVITPRGGQYQVTLADGSKVWLNAASTLRFPVSFKGRTDRNVELSGEAYFEVAKDAARPFRVMAAGEGRKMEIEVLGTHFNVMAYKDESSIRATLLEGSVRVKSGAGSAMLKPGQQARLGEGTDIEIIKDIDMGQVTAWKDGHFEFAGEDIRSVMRQLCRWYNIDVQYTGNISAHFMGTISRNVNAWDVFRMLEMTGTVKFTAQEEKIVVSP